MRLGELLKGCDYINKDLPVDLNISGVAYDSRKVKEGYLFVAIKGERFDGHDFIEDVIKKGAGAVVHEKANPPYPPLLKGGEGGLITRH